MTSIDISLFGMHATIFPAGVLLLLALVVLGAVGAWKLFHILR